MENCIFCKIAAGEIPSSKVYEDEKVYAFLDTSQVTEGHTLLIPKKHVANIFEYDEKLAAEVFSYLPKIANALQKAYPEMKGLNILQNNGEVAYQTVFHSHVHLVPRYQRDEGFKVYFADNSDSYTQEEFQQRGQKISDQF